MLKYSLTIILCLASWHAQAVELNKRSLKHALTSKKTPAEVQKALKDLAAYGKDKASILAKRIGTDNLTYFLLSAKEGALKGMDLRFKGELNKRAMTMMNKLVKDGCFITMADVRRLVVGPKTGSFFVNNECLRGTILFRMDTNGNLTKMVIPRMGSKSMKGGTIIFEKK